MRLNSSAKTAKNRKWKLWSFNAELFSLGSHELLSYFAPSLGYAVNKRELTIEINLCLLQISPHVAMATFMTWLWVSPIEADTASFMSTASLFLTHGRFFSWDIGLWFWNGIFNIFYLQRLFRVVRLVAAWETRRRIVSIVKESRVLLTLSWFGRRYWLRAGASSLRHSRSDGYSWTKRRRLSKLWHFSFAGGNERFTSCLISLQRIGSWIMNEFVT